MKGGDVPIITKTGGQTQEFQRFIIWIETRSGSTLQVNSLGVISVKRPHTVSAVDAAPSVTLPSIDDKRSVLYGVQ